MVLRWTVRLIAAAAGLTVLAAALFLIPAVQQTVVRIVLSGITDKTQTRITIGSLSFGLTNTVRLNDLFVEDRHRDTLLSVGTLAVDINLLSLFSRTVELRNIRLRRVTAHIVRTLPDSSYNFAFLLDALSSDTVSASKDTSVTDWTFRAGTLEFEDIQGTFRDEVSGTDLQFHLGTASLNSIVPDLSANRYTVGEVSLSNTSIAIHRTGPPLPDTAETESTGKPWEFRLDRFSAVNLAFTYDIGGTERTRGLNLQHLQCDSISLAVNSIIAGPEHITAVIEHGAFHERGGLNLRTISGAVVFDSVHAAVNNLLIETDHSSISQTVHLTYPSLHSLYALSDSIGVSMTFAGDRIAFSDLRYFQPALPLKDSLVRSFSLHADISGSVRELHIDRFALTAGDSTALLLDGTVRGISDIETVHVNGTLRKFQTGRNDIAKIMTDSLLPKGIVLPEILSVTGAFNGTLSDADASVSLNSSIGTISGKGTLRSRGRERWNITLIAEKFNAGVLLNDTMMFGPVSFTAAAAGNGFSAENFSGKADVHAASIFLNGYPYRNIQIRASGDPGAYIASARVKDPSLDLGLSAAWNIADGESVTTAALTVNGADLQRLNVTEENIRVAGTISGTLNGSSANSLSGTVAATKIIIMKDEEQYRIDSIVVSSLRTDGVSHLRFDAPFLEARFDGTIAPADLPEAFRRHIAYYLQRGTGLETNEGPAQAFQFRIALKDPSLLRSVFLPDLRVIDMGVMEGSFNSLRHELNASFSVPKVRYGSMGLDSLALTVTSDERMLSGKLSVRSVSDSLFRIANLLFSADARNDSLKLLLQSRRDNSDTLLHLSALIMGVQDGYTVHLEEEGTVIGSIPWSIPAGNLILIGPNSITTTQLHLKSGDRSFSVLTDKSTDVLSVRFSRFELAALSRIAEREPGMLSGTMNGSIVFSPPDAKRPFAADLTITDLHLSQRAVGDISLQAEARQGEQYTAQLNITGNGNRIALNGTLNAAAAATSIDATGTFTRVNLASFEPFLFGSVQDLSGSLSGTVRLSGTLQQPALSGSIAFARTEFTPTLLGTHLFLNSGTVNISSSGVGLRGFNFTDIHGHTASLSGTLFTNDYQTFRYEMRMKSRNFMLLNLPPKRDALFYGTVLVSSDGSVHGDMWQHVLTMQASVEKGTDLALIMPASGTSIEERKGIVRFDGPPKPEHPILAGTETADGQQEVVERSSSMDVSSNIRVTKETKLRILIDPVAGDSLVVQGDATFSVTIDPAGKLSLTGRYEIASGVYQLSFGDFINKTFGIVKGSSLTWLGSPLDAEVDITAVSTVKTSILELVQSQLSGMSNEERTKYKQKLPFQVFMNMKGNLRAPVIHFRLDLPPEQRGVLNGTVYAKLNDINGQESELNKQVFALLILGKFVRENPVSSADGGGASDLARSSVSQLLSAQLNALSERYIAGATLDVGVDSYKDFSSGTAEGRTQLQLALSKQLFNERVTVQVGGNVDLEGERSQKNSLNSLAGDLTVQYKLTEDGRWKLQVFRQNSYEGALDGDVTKTGAGVAFSIDFNKLFGISLVPDQEEKE